jgi:hypothetical protein
MFLSFQYGLRPTRAQHRALDAILEGQRLLYNAALQERIEAWRSDPLGEHDVGRHVISLTDKKSVLRHQHEQ